MSTQVLDVFSLRDSVVGEYKNFATSFSTIYADDIRQQIEAIYASDRLKLPFRGVVLVGY